MNLNNFENYINNQSLSINQRFLYTNNLFKNELKKIKSNLIKKRIENDSLKYIRLIEYQNIQKNLISNENKEESITSTLKLEGAPVDISIPKKIMFKLFFFQIIALIRWLINRKRKLKFNIYILNSVAEDLLAHIYKKKRNQNIEIIIPSKFIFSLRRKFFKTVQINEDREQIQNLNFNLDKLYKIRESYYSQTELIIKEICFFINDLCKFKFVSSIICFANHQSYLENYLSSEYKNTSTKWKGVYIALHGGNYGISYGYPIMYYHCCSDLNKSPKFLLPLKLHNHFFEDINTHNKKLSLTLSKQNKILRKQYGFEILKKVEKSRFKNYNLYVFANNLLPYVDPWTNYYNEFKINQTLERWQKYKLIWKKGSVFIVVRPSCKKYLLNFYKKEMDLINLISIDKSSNLDNSHMIFEGQSSAIREHSMQSTLSIIYLPKRIFNLSKHNFIEQESYFKNNFIKIVEEEKKLFEIIQLVS